MSAGRGMIMFHYWRTFMTKKAGLQMFKNWTQLRLHVKVTCVLFWEMLLCLDVVLRLFCFQVPLLLFADYKIKLCQFL